jgi:hypothetical protein
MVLPSHLLNQSQAVGMQLMARLPPFVTFGLVVALGLGLARLGWLLVPPPAGMAWEAPPAAARGGPVTRGGDDLQKLLSAQLFGAYVADRMPRPRHVSTWCSPASLPAAARPIPAR